MQGLIPWVRSIQDGEAEQHKAMGKFNFSGWSLWYRDNNLRHHRRLFCYLDQVRRSDGRQWGDRLFHTWERLTQAVQKYIFSPKSRERMNPLRHDQRGNVFFDRKFGQYQQLERTLSFKREWNDRGRESPRVSYPDMDRPDEMFKDNWNHDVGRNYNQTPPQHAQFRPPHNVHDSHHDGGPYISRARTRPQQHFECDGNWNDTRYEQPPSASQAHFHGRPHYVGPPPQPAWWPRRWQESRT